MEHGFSIHWIFYYLKGGCKKAGERLFIRACSDRTEEERLYTARVGLG